MTYGEKAKELKDTLNCAQSVVVALDELTGLDEKTSKALPPGLPMPSAPTVMPMASTAPQ